MRPAVRFIAVALILCLAQGALADDRAVARQAYREGTRQFEIGDYRAALAAFKRAYLAYEEPAFLFNIGQCQRLLGEKRAALRSYKVYLRKAPRTPNRSEIQKLVSSLEEAIARDQEAAALPPTGVEEERGAPGEAPAPTAAAPTAAEEEPAAGPAVAAAPSPATDRSDREARPLHKRWWFWTAIGGGAVAIGLAVGLGLGLSSHGDFRPTLPDVGPATSALRVGF